MKRNSLRYSGKHLMKPMKENEKYTGFYPSLPGCIASAEGKNQLKEEMRTALKKWIRSAFYMWRENNILEE